MFVCFIFMCVCVKGEGVGYVDMVGRVCVRVSGITVRGKVSPKAFHLEIFADLPGTERQEKVKWRRKEGKWLKGRWKI